MHTETSSQVEQVKMIEKAEKNLQNLKYQLITHLRGKEVQFLSNIP